MNQKISIISFTENGIRLSIKIRESLSAIETVLYAKCSNHSAASAFSQITHEERSVAEWAKEQMEKKNVLLFIGACGIAVRAIAPNVVNKLCDSPVLVMDEKGSYVIPILSGHMGGANEFAMLLSEKMKAVPVITTATDLNQKFAVDLFAKKNYLSVVNKEGIAKISSKVLAGKQLKMSIETGHIEEEQLLPEEITLVSYPPPEPVDVVVSSEKSVFDTLLLLKPKEYVIGIGCRKGKEAEKIADFISSKLEEMGINETQIQKIASIDQKKNEIGIIEWSRQRRIPYITFSAEELQKVEGIFHSSAFVEKNVGVDNVCERASLKACGIGGKLICEKYAQDGMTIAIAKREWRIEFDEQ